MSSKNIAIAYCQENKKVAETIESHLGGISGGFQHYSCTRTTTVPSIAEQLQSHSGPILLVVSDNFLKSAQCMHNSLKMLQQKGDRILPIVIDGVTKDESTGEWVKISTEFDRVSDIIQYINYWQDQYLDLRRQKRQIEDLDEDKFNAHLKVMRSISSEAGEFLRLLRSTSYVDYEEFTANHFQKFFQFINDTEGWERFQRQHPEPPPVSQEPSPPAPEETPAETGDTPGFDLEEIPGISQLEDASGEKASEPQPPPETEDIRQPEPVEENPEEIREEPIVSEEESIVEEPSETEDLPEDGADLVEEPEPEEEKIPGSELASVLSKTNHYFNSDQTEMAFDLLQKAIERYPNNVELNYRYALALAQHTEDFESASGQLEKVLKLDPENEDAYFLLGEFAEIGEDFEKARSCYKKVIDLKSNYPEVHFRMGILLANHFEGKEKEAAKYFKKAAKKNPENAEALYQYAMLLNEKLDKPGKAAKFFKKTLKAQPEHPFANYDLALLYYQAGEAEKARKAYLKAVAINPELKTEENEQAFALATVDTPRETIQQDVIHAEHSTIEALRENINRLEELLQSREQEIEKVKEEAIEEKYPSRIDKTVFITGATSGIGRATAEIFAQNGYRLILNGRREDRLKELEAHFKEEYDSEVQLLPFDVRNRNSVNYSIQQLQSRWQEIDILINNAGKAKGLDPIHEGRIEHWEEMIDTNIKGLLYLTRAITPHMVQRRSGHIINICSTAGKEVYPKGNVYCATKHAVDALTQAMRLDLHEYDIRVSQVSPAHVEETEFALVRFDGDEEKAKIYEDFQPLTSHDVAEAIFFMATRPPHVNVQDVIMMGTQQASSLFINRSGRDIFEEEE